jgi:hypothetical protein
MVPFFPHKNLVLVLGTPSFWFWCLGAVLFEDANYTSSYVDNAA